MSQKVLVSIIVPVYNVEHYLPACIESLLAQCVEGMEIILVNDGSTDNSYAICQDYASRYPNIRVFSQENKGLSATRNLGLRYIQGDIVGFVDSDDELAPGTIKAVLNAFEHSPECDMVQIPVLINWEHSTEQYTCRGQGTIIGRRQLQDAFAITEMMSWRVCDKFFRAELLDGYNFVEGRVYEDNIYMSELLLRCKGIVLIQEGLYKYRWNAGSITHTHSTKNYRDMVWVHGQMLEYLQKGNASRDAQTALIYMIAHDIRSAQMGDAKFAQDAIELGEKYLRAYGAIKILTSWRLSWRKRLKALYVKLSLLFKS